MKKLPNYIRHAYHTLTEMINNLGPSLRKRSYCGVKLFYNKNNALIKRLKNEPIFEKKMCDSIVFELSKSTNPIFLDIGANIGFVSLYILSKVPSVTIHAFEPGQVQRELFARTVSENSLAKIDIHPEALGYSNGTTLFQVHDPKYSALDGFYDTHRRGATRPVEVPMITLDSWWVNAGKPSVPVVKIDTEGAELLILRGAQDFIRQNKPIIFLEIEPRNLKAYPYGEKDIFTFFEGMNYTLEALTIDTYIARAKL